MTHWHNLIRTVYLEERTHQVQEEHQLHLLQLVQHHQLSGLLELRRGLRRFP